jgi:gamma-glutamyltranspeptidase/glutathione hydrolase
MGGHMQPQGHLQVVSHLVDRGLDPQAALDEPRWRLDHDARNGWTLALEEPLHRLAPELARRGHRVLCDPVPDGFGGGQTVLVRDDVLIGGSESRKDGVAFGY